MAPTRRCRTQWAGQLGDGRAINLGAAVGPDGQAWELQLKVSAAVRMESVIPKQAHDDVELRPWRPRFTWDMSCHRPGGGAMQGHL